MARTAVPYTPFVADSHVTDPAGTTIDATNSHYIPATYGSNPAHPASPELTLLRVTNTSGAGKVVTVKASNNPPALASGLGDLTVTVAATTGVEWIGPVESGRFIQNDGTMNVDIAAGHTGTITAFYFPRNT